jgi:hypothetical protein
MQQHKHFLLFFWGLGSWGHPIALGAESITEQFAEKERITGRSLLPCLAHFGNINISASTLVCTTLAQIEGATGLLLARAFLAWQSPASSRARTVLAVARVSGLAWLTMSHIASAVKCILSTHAVLCFSVRQCGMANDYKRAQSMPYDVLVIIAIFQRSTHP